MGPTCRRYNNLNRPLLLQFAYREMDPVKHAFCNIHGRTCVKREVASCYYRHAAREGHKDDELVLHPLINTTATHMGG
eukprot:scaffold400639_cov38-Prasinocladus_malaysianus.AAC.1